MQSPMQICSSFLTRFLTFVEMLSFNTNVELFKTDIYLPVKRTQYQSEIMDE